MAGNEEKMKTIFYDKNNDILALHKGFLQDEGFKGNLDAGDLVLDISTKGRVRGVEIFNAVSFLKEFGVTGKILNTLKDASFNAVVRPASISLGIIFKSAEREIPAKVAVPLKAF